MSDSFSHYLSPTERRVVWWGVGVLTVSLLYLTVGPCLAFTLGFLAFGVAMGYKQAERQRIAQAMETVPTMEFGAAPAPDEPLIRLVPGQELVICRPIQTQVEVPHGVRLQVLEATADVLRVRAVAAKKS